MDTLDVIQTLTELASLTASIRKAYADLAETQAKVQLAKSAIGTAIHELETTPDAPDEPDWLIKYLRGVLENLK